MAAQVYWGICTVPGCGRTLRPRGWCAAHYFRWKATGDPQVDVPIGANRWTQARAEAVAARVGVELLEPFGRIDYPGRFRCLTCGVEGCKPIHEMRYATDACWPCSRVRAGLSGRLTAATIRESFAASGYDLIGQYVRSRIPVLVRCRRCGTEAMVRLSNVRSKGNACSKCRYDAYAVRYRLPEDEVAARCAVAEVELLEPFVSTHHAIKTRCLVCGNVSTRKLDWHKKVGSCVRCGARPFDFSLPAVVYLLHHTRTGAVKVGVSNLGKDRLDIHRSHGWKVVVERSTSGECAYLAEQAVLGWWRHDLGVPTYLGAGDMPQRGHTETASAALVDIKAAVAFIEQATADFEAAMA